MVEFYPWSRKVLNENIHSQQIGNMPVLDLELTAQCTGASCIYCDSKPRVGCAHANEIDWTLLYNIMMQSQAIGLKWVYTCGLGEPMEDGKFWDLLDFIKRNDINLSMFTNGVFIKDINIARRLKDSNVHIILKLDTFDEKKFDRVLNIPGTAKKVYAANEFLLSAGYGSHDGQYTDLAYSIVPTIFSLDGIPEVIDFAAKYGVFASIGELENAGNVYTKGIKDIINVAPDELLKLKNYADAYAGGIYKRPICSAILTGLHIDNLGDCIVDRKSGLNCKWFLLNEPDTYYIGNVKNETVENLLKKVNAYRKEQFEQNKKLFSEYRQGKFVFGGCGGNIQEVFELAFKLNEME
ncbi:MAG: radical SAM protein [Roseburia sp.]|nr:radical SAM protein [Roseburia sp.]